MTLGTAIIIMFNDFYARRTSQLLLFQNIYRAHGPMYRATQLTREALNGRLMREEFMRINGQRAMPLLVGASTIIAPELSNFAWDHLMGTQAPSTSFRAQVVQRQSPLSRHVAKVGLLRENTSVVRTETSMQVMLLDQVAWSEGVQLHVPLLERQDLTLVDDEDDLLADDGTASPAAVTVGGTAPAK